MTTLDPSLRFATVEFDADGVTTDWEVSFVGGYINPSHVYAMSVALDPETGLEDDRQQHSTTIVSESSEAATVRVSPAVPAGRRLYIFRSTTIAQMLVDYINGSVLTRQNLNLSNDQLLKLIQEIHDNVAMATRTVDNQTEVIIDTERIIREIYERVIELLEAGGIVSVTPQVWSWVTDDVTQDYPMPGANVVDAGHYDTYLSGLGLNPEEDFEVLVDPDDLESSTLRLTNPPPEGALLFTVLRGFARPYTGPQPVTNLGRRINIREMAPVYFPNIEDEFALLRSTLDEPAVCEINPSPVGNIQDRLGSGSYFSVQQAGAGQVSIVAAEGVSLEFADGFVPTTRAQNSVITCTCIDDDINLWLITGDMARE